MTEEKTHTEKIEETQAPPSTSAPEVASTAAPPSTPSVGEKWWNRLTYTAVGYLANLALSVYIWDELSRGKAKPLLDAASRGVGKGFQAAGMEAKAAREWGEKSAFFAAATMGGHLTMIPLKILEDNARTITHKFNKTLDPNYEHKDLKIDATTTEDQLPALVNEPTRNTWPQIILRRGLGMLGVTAAGLALDKSGWRIPLEENTLKVINSVVKTDHSPRMQRYAKLTALDAYFTVITAVITAASKNMFGSKKGGSSDDALSIDIPCITEDDPSCHPAVNGKPLAKVEKKPESFTARVAAEHNAPNYQLGI